MARPSEGVDWHLFERFKTREEAMRRVREKRSDRRYAWRVHIVSGPAGKQYRVEYQHRGAE